MNDFELNKEAIRLIDVGQHDSSGRFAREIENDKAKMTAQEFCKLMKDMKENVQCSASPGSLPEVSFYEEGGQIRSLKITRTLNDEDRELITMDRNGHFVHKHIERSGAENETASLATNFFGKLWISAAQLATNFVLLETARKPGFNKQHPTLQKMIEFQVGKVAGF